MSDKELQEPALQAVMAHRWPRSTPRTDSDLRAEALQVVRAHIAAINAWDLEGMRALFTEDTVMEMPYAPPGFQAVIAGRGPVLDFVALCASLIAAENLHDLELDTLHGDPCTVVGTYRSDMVIGTRSYRNEYIARWRVRDGRIAYFGEYFDPIRLVIATGGKVEPGSFGS